MKEEFNSNAFYSNEDMLWNVWGDKKQEQIEALSWEGTGQAPRKYWMSFPAHGYLLADTYRRPVILFSDGGPSTYLPLSYPPTNNPPIGLMLHDLHLISFNFKAEIWPSPRVDPFWKHWAEKEALAWKEWIQPNLDLGEKVLFPPKRRSSRLNKNIEIDI